VELAARCLPTGMIGNDALPQTHPANYRFAPGNSGRVSRYFRMLASVETLVCISEESRQDMWQRLRRNRALTTTVALPGGDHLAARQSAARGSARFLRIGTFEARKRPREILRAFSQAVASGTQAELVFVGKESKSDFAINADVEQAMAAGLPVRWIRHTSDAGIADLMNQASVFLSFGVEGYGIPVLESIRQSTPVLYSGIQPAAEVMRGRGARPVVADTIDEIAAMFQDFASPGALADLRAEVDPHAVPTWRQFSHDIASAMLQAIRRN
ncbi:MAG: glycosyltransferase, partial [Chloroflexi bacterium]|nr:glycosyltransferase [Chloroflexota bacterium]